MENEIKVGEYIRTPEQGFIGKLIEINKDVLNYYKIDVGREIRRDNGWSDNYIYSRDGFGLKHSLNLIDLIEVGDYVNGIMVEEFDDEEGNLYLGFPIYDDALMDCIEEVRPLSTVDIETIVTKEQMKDIEYRVGGK